MSVVFIVGARPIVGFFTTDPDSLGYGVESLRVIAFGYGFYALGMVIVQAFNGAGDTTTPTKLNFLCFWLFQLPMAWLLSHHTDLGLKGVFWAVMMADGLLALSGAFMFRRGKWKEKEV